MKEPRISPLCVEGVLHVLSSPTGKPHYDFDFERFFECTHPVVVPEVQPAVARIGAFSEYSAAYEGFASRNLLLINSVEEHDRAGLISNWYPLLEDITPRTVVWDEPPSASEVAASFDWPVFVKGERQTSRHQDALSIARSAEEFERAMEQYARDPILRWQKVAVREFVPLLPVPGEPGRNIPPSVELRTFWWRGECVGDGRYWTEVPDYQVSEMDRDAAVQIAAKAAARVNVPFLVVDVARTSAGKWIVIECNDAQESGYAGVAPLPLWRRIIELESD